MHGVETHQMEISMRNTSNNMNEIISKILVRLLTKDIRNFDFWIIKLNVTNVIILDTQTEIVEVV